eukprot:UN01549
MPDPETTEEASMDVYSSFESQETSVAPDEEDDVSSVAISTPNDSILSSQSDDSTEMDEDSNNSESNSTQDPSNSQSDSESIFVNSNDNNNSPSRDSSTSQIMSESDDSTAEKESGSESKSISVEVESDDIDGGESDTQEGNQGTVVMDAFGDTSDDNDGRSSIIVVSICSFVIVGLVSGLLCVYCKTRKYHKYSKKTGLIA